VCCGYCGQKCLCAVVTVGNIGSVLWLLKGTVAVGTVGKSGCVLCVL